MLAFLFIDSPREYLVAILVTWGICSVGAVLFFIAAYRATTRPGKRYPVHVPERFLLPREPHIDLAAEREAFELRREAREENELLRRAV